MNHLFSRLEPQNLRKSWWIKFLPTPCQHILILSCFLWLLFTRNYRNSLPFQRIPINSSRYHIMVNLKFQVTSPIHWISRHLSRSRLKSLIVNRTSTKSWVIFLLIKGNQAAILFQSLKTKKIRKSISKLMKRDRVLYQHLWHLNWAHILLRFRQVNQQNLRITKSMCLSLTLLH
jgi:hypothetical protein